MTLKFLGFIDEEDGTTTAECVDEKGVIHEFRNVRITGITESKSEITATDTPMMIVMEAVDE